MTEVIPPMQDSMNDGTRTEPEGPLLPGVSIVVPVYNGAGSIPALTDRVHRTLGIGDNWELLLVVDGSPDHSWVVVEQLVGQYPNVVGINMFRNFGQHNAVLAGIRAARHEIVVTMDDDLQHRPESIPDLLTAMTSGIDLVYGISSAEEHAWWRNLSSRLAKAAMGASIGGRMLRDSGAFRAFRTPLRDGFVTVSDPFVSIDVLLSWVTTRYTTTPTPMDRREIGRSNYTVRKLLRHALNMIVGYSTKPLRLVSWLGFCLAMFGAAVLIYVLVRYVSTDDPVPGFPFLASLVAILAGAQLFGLGVIGEYLGRIHFRSMQRPTYVIRDVLRRGAAAPTGSEDTDGEAGRSLKV
ncbi:MAG: glycosyl transferase [Acidimicrobiales bacterium]|nr:glycosyl transferase [Acidimicrobiales bacterium]